MGGRESLLALAVALAVLAFAACTVVAEPTKYIADPRYSAPYVVLPGQVLNVTVYGAESVTKAWIVAPGVEYELKVVGTYQVEGGVKVCVKVPKDAKPELYDIYVEVNGEELREPRSLWVLKTYPNSITIMHLTDIHVGVTTDRPAYVYYWGEAVLANTLDIDIVVVTGDSIDVGSDIPSFKVFYEITNSIRKPTFVVPGNHEHSQTDERGFRERYYGRYVGPADWYRVIGDFVIVGMDTGSEGFLSKTQLSWFESIAKAHKDKVIIVLMHHPIFRYRTFGPVQCKWDNLEAIKDKIYSSWAEHMESAKEFMRIVEQYNVRLVFSGHVHGDSVVIYNDKTVFIVTTTAGGSLRTGDHHGFRIVKVSKDGSVEILAPEGKDPWKEPATFNADEIYVRTWVGSGGTAYTVAISVGPGFDVAVDEFTLYMYLSPEAKEYKAYGEYESFEILPYGSAGYVAVAKVRVGKGESKKLTVAASPDESPPSVRILMYTPRKPVASKDKVTVFVKATDEEWGVESVYVYYEVAGTKKSVEATLTTPGNYRAVIPAINASEVKVWAVATDLAGNKAESEPVTIKYVVPKPPEQQPQPQQQIQSTQQQQQQQTQVQQEQQPQQPQQPEKPVQEEVKKELPVDFTVVVAAVVAAIVVIALIIAARRR